MEALEPMPHAESPMIVPASELQPGQGQRLTERQIEAVYAVMRLLRDDGARPSSPEEIFCARCQRQRPGQGSVTYGSSLLCNGCATDYELLRAARNVRKIEDFLVSG